MTLRIVAVLPGLLLPVSPSSPSSLFSPSARLLLLSLLDLLVVLLPPGALRGPLFAVNLLYFFRILFFFMGKGRLLAFPPPSRFLGSPSLDLFTTDDLSLDLAGRLARRRDLLGDSGLLLPSDFRDSIQSLRSSGRLLLFLSLGEVALRETLALKTGLLLVLAGDGPSLSSIRLLRSRSLLLSRLLSFDSSWRALRLGGVRDRLSLRPLSFS